MSAGVFVVGENQGSSVDQHSVVGGLGPGVAVCGRTTTLATARVRTDRATLYGHSTAVDQHRIIACGYYTSGTVAITHTLNCWHNLSHQNLAVSHWFDTGSGFHIAVLYFISADGNHGHL